MAIDQHGIVSRSSAPDLSARQYVDDDIAGRYQELRRIAASFISREADNHILQATALVHEAFIRLARSRTKTWSNQDEFVRTVAKIMRRVLIDHARAFRSQKRSNAGNDTVFAQLAVYNDRAIDLLDLDRALTDLEQFDKQKARVVELRFFGGLTNGEIARNLSISRRTVEREWSIARAWLYTSIIGRE